MKYLKVILGVLLLVNSPLYAGTKCVHEKESVVDLDVTDINRLRIELGADKMQLAGHAGDSAEFTVRMCASSQSRLDKMAIRQLHSNDLMTLEFDAGGQSNYGWSLFGRSGGEDYGRFEISATVPQRILVDLALASGEADITGVKAVHSSVASGSLTLEKIEHEVNTQVSSGSVRISQAGALTIKRISSGQVRAEQIQGSVRIDSIGSGQARLSHLTGDLYIGHVGSGSSQAEHVGGIIEVGSIGSGSVRVDHAEGDMKVGSVGSGNIRGTNILGNVSLDRKGSGSLHTNNIGGRVVQPDSKR